MLELAMSAPGLDLRERLYSQMALVRRFEERVLDLFSQSELVGTTHCYVGQEAIAVGVLNHLQPQDVVVSNHRCHGHFLVRTGDVEGLMAELMGRSGGPCGGRGGSQHLHKENFFTNGILGSTIPVAAGMAYAEKKRGTGAIVVIFMGDGAFGEGTVYETFNLVSLWRVPLLVVVENNRYAQTTPLNLNFAGSFQGRAQAFGLSFGEVESNDAEELHGRFATIIEKVRSGASPHIEVVHTYRLCAHSKGDDTRPAEELEAWRLKDPLRILGARIPPERVAAINAAAADRVAQAERAARETPLPTLGAGAARELGADRRAQPLRPR